MDQPLADHDKILQQLQQTFSSECIDFGAERNTMFWESIAVAQEDSLEYFLEHGDLPQEEIARLVSCRSVFPCFFGSALKQEGITEELKSRDQMEWVRQANNVRSRVDEIILSELVYV